MELSKETKAELLKACPQEELEAALNARATGKAFSGGYKVHVCPSTAAGLYYVRASHNYEPEGIGEALLSSSELRSLAAWLLKKAGE